MKVIGLTGTSGGEYIVTMSKAEMMRVLGESYMADEKLPKTGHEVKLAKAWDIVTYIRERTRNLESLRDSVQLIERAVERAIDDVATPLIVET